MAISVIAKLVQKNNGTFKLVNADAVSYDGTETVSIKDKVDEAIQKVELKTSVVLSDTEPTGQDTGDLWMQDL